MRSNPTKYNGIMLVLLSALYSTATISAVKPVNNTHAPQSNGTYSSTSPSYFDLSHGHTVIQLGGFWASQGEAQDINIQGLVGNHYAFTSNNHNQSNGLVGLGYYLDGFHYDHVQLNYGLNVFYLGPTSVSGDVIQEQLYSNLNYHYKIQHTPLYLDAKAIIKTNSERYNVTLDVGVGPNFMRTSNYSETPLDVYTIPDNAFSAHNNVAFTATAGLGFRLNNIFGEKPLECGYRFFYLGKGQLARNNDQLINTVVTGNTYANALLCSVTI